MARRSRLARAEICDVGPGEKLPWQLPNSMMLCPSGNRFDSHRLEDSLIHVPHITEHHREIRNRAPLRRA
jgi:hypothetical protein